MRAKDHLEEAERLLFNISPPRQSWEDIEVLGAALKAIGHALTAIAIESGVPHAAVPGQEQNSE